MLTIGSHHLPVRKSSAAIQADNDTEGAPSRSHHQPLLDVKQQPTDVCLFLLFLFHFFCCLFDDETTLHPFGRANKMDIQKKIDLREIEDRSRADAITRREMKRVGLYVVKKGLLFTISVLLFISFDWPCIIPRWPLFPTSLNAAPCDKS